MAALAVVIPFPMHRVRRAHRAVDVFGALRDQAELDRSLSRFVWTCTLATTLMSLALQLSLG